VNRSPRTLVGALVLALGLLLSGCALNTEPTFRTGTAVAGGGTSKAAVGARTTYDVTPLLHPDKKYFGAALSDIPKSLAKTRTYQSTVGKAPNLLAFYASWGDAYDVSGVRRIFGYGALPYMAWEPYHTTLEAIADGRTDDYVRSVAQSVLSADVPVAISFGHEMNGDWYPWGRQAATADQFVRAWKHVHDIFQQVGATNVIWVWSPNNIYPAPKVKLKPYYPGDAYVDWVGVIGYYTVDGPRTFSVLFDPTFRQVRTFSKRPFLISETASEMSGRRLADVDDLFSGVQARSDVLGFIWFDIVKRADWRIERTPGPLADFKRRASNPVYGFDVRNP
jgi:hypothetical protein